LAEYDDNDLLIFRKFIHYTPENHEKIKKMMEGDDCVEFCIHEMDLIRYYKDFKIKTLSDALKSGESQKKVLKTAYLLNEQTLK
jgi:uncharacterized Zn ribbon protein